MDRTMYQKAECPAVYVGESCAINRKTKLHQTMSVIARLVFFSLFVGVCFGLVYQTISDKQNYDKLLAKYNSVVQNIRTTDILLPTTLVPRAAESESVSYTYTTTTLTRGTTITLTEAPSTTSEAISSTISSPISTTISSTGVSATSSGCGTDVPQTVFVTVTVQEPVGAVSSTASSLESASTVASVLASSTPTLSTRITTTTVLITASSSAPPQAQTDTLTSTDVIVVTTTEGATASAPASSGTSISTLYGAFGSLPAPSHFPNTTSAVYGSSFATTVNYTMTLPPLGTGTGTGTGTGKVHTSHGTTTSRSDPVNTVMSALADRTAVRGSAIALSVVFMAFMAHI